jgi:hypothetical protein
MLNPIFLGLAMRGAQVHMYMVRCQTQPLEFSYALSSSTYGFNKILELTLLNSATR